jgi:hypothetical protein
MKRMDSGEHLVVIENELERSLRNGLHEALKWIEDLPAETNIEYLKKTSAYVELLCFILNFSKFLGSTQTLILASMKRRKVLPKRQHFEKAERAGLYRSNLQTHPGSHNTSEVSAG